MTDPLAAWRGGIERLDHRWRDLPLRTRLTSAAALAATVTIVAVVAVAYLAVRHELRAQVDKDLGRQAADINVRVYPDPFGQLTVEVPKTLDEPGAVVQAVTANKAGPLPLVIPVTPRDQLVAERGGYWIRDAHVNGTHVRVLTRQSRQVDGLAIQVAAPLSGVDHQLRVLAFLFALLAVGGLFLVVVTSWGVVRRTMRPVRTLTDTAEQIAQTRDLTVRIESFGDDEIGRLAKTFNVMLDELQRSLGAQRQLVLDASHELRTPLASLRTNVEILGDIDRLTPQQRKATLDGIVSQLEELTGLVADVVELARGEAPPSQYDDLALDELVERAVDRARRHWPTVHFVCETSPVLVRGVAARLDRAVANMLDNAGKFSPAGSVVDVRLIRSGMLTVADHGPGVPAQSLPFVFDRFYRADEARALPGSGLGLAIVKQVVEEHNGTIALTNRVGGGALATLTLPVLDLPEPVAVPTPEERSLFR